MSVLFSELGEAIARKWEQTGRSEAEFIEIATSALRDSQLLSRVEPEDIVNWLIGPGELPRQDVHEFGQPPINLYIGEGFYIQALFWIDGTTSIHEHSFVGAFGVLHGSSVHSTYEFTPERAASKRLVTGRVKFLKSELLTRGDVRSIFSADRLIHALFHLDRPSVSIVVRTCKPLQGGRPQYYYAKPYLALDDHELPAHMTIQRRMLESLWKTNRPGFWVAAKRLAAHCDPFMLYQTLAIAYLDTSDAKSWDELLAIARENNPWLIDRVLPCLLEENRSERIRSLRNTVHDATHRFFLGLLLNVPSREQLFNLIAQRFPGEDPRVLVVRWLGEIFEKEQSGVKLTRSWLCLIDRMLQSPEFEDSREYLRERFRSGDQANEEKLRNAWNHLQSFEILKPLLTTTSAALAV